ncbi:MAG: hypothetical protein JO250_21620 [Armatimonadetes bacterium]|nr:hypothetical protein [Armatimonadota bacterium]
METKVCKYCLVEQPVERFEVANIIKGKVYRRLKCSACKNKMQLSRKRKLRAWLDVYKKGCVCEQCGYSDFRALQFHHRDSKQKEVDVASMIGQGVSLAKLKNEIAKCSTLCANCHAIEHYYRSSDVETGV